MARRSVWGWGTEGDSPDPAAVAGFAEHLGFGRTDLEAPAPPSLPDPVLPIPPELRDCATDDAYDRARFGLGSSYLDTVRGFRGDFSTAPDFVVHAWTEDAVMRTLVSRHLPSALAADAIVVSDLPLEIAGARPLPLPRGAREGRYFLYRHGAPG